MAVLKRINKTIVTNLLNTSIPTIIAFLLSDVFTIVDTILIGAIKNESIYAASLSAINISARVLLFISAISRGINVSSSTILSRYLATNDKEKIQSTLIHTIILNVFVISLPLVIICLIFAKPIILFIGNDPMIYEVGKGYYIAIIIGFSFSSFNNIMAFLTRAVGESKTTLKLETFANIFNIIGGIVLINGLWIFPKLNVTGAGIATLIYKIILFFLYIKLLLKSNSKLKIDFKYKFKYDPQMIKNLLKIGLPGSTELLSIRGANIIFTKIIAYLGTTVLAAQQICMTIFNFLVEIGNALSVSVAPLVSKCIGEEKPKTARLYIKYSCLLSLIISTIVGLILVIFFQPILNLYTDSENIKLIVNTVLLVMILAQYVQNIRDVYAGGLRGIGDTKYIAKYTILADVILKLILAYMCIYILNLNLLSVWIVTLLIELFKAFALSIKFNYRKWENIKL